ncbi:MAG: hypothetical protein KDA29_07010 [Phycisphaerales bacterium]|nr:hypothetical protein [Phycisphaerales bacterium]
MRFSNDVMRTLNVSLACCGLATSATAQQGGLDCAYGQNLGMHELDNLPRSVALSGQVAFFGNDQGIVAYSVSNPESPLELGSLSGSQVALMEPSGNELFVSTGVGGATLGVIDISNPSGMSVMSTFVDPSLTRILSIARDGDVLYVGSDNGTVMVLDISDLGSPIEIAMLSLAGSVGGLDVEGDRLYAASNPGGTSIFDISDVMNPVLLGSFGNDDATGVEVEGDTAYVLDRDYGFRVYDCGNAASVVVLADIELERPLPWMGLNVFQHQLVDDRYYVRGPRHFAYDVSDPSNPVEVGEFETPYRTTRYGAFEAELAILISEEPEHGFELFDVGTMYFPPVGELIFKSGTINEAGYLFDYRLRNLPTPHYSLETFDISDPQNPVTIGEYDPQYSQQGLLVPYGSYLLRSDAGIEMQVIDASDPADLQQVASLTIGDGLAFQGGTFRIGDGGLVALWATETGRVQFGDLSDPSSPSIVGEYDFGSDEANEVKTVEVRDGYAFASLYSKEIAVLDLTDISSPVEIGRVIDPQIPSRNMQLEHSGGVLYVGSANQILAYSMLNPASPVFVGEFMMGNSVLFPTSLHSEGDVLYLTVASNPDIADYNRLPSLTALDISDPSMITVAGGTTPFAAGETQYLDGIVYLTNGSQTNAVTLSVGCGTCLADLTGDGVLNFFDVSAFLNAYNASAPLADLNGDGMLNFFDVSAFLNAYNAGCP